MSTQLCIDCGERHESNPVRYQCPVSQLREAVRSGEGIGARLAARLLPFVGPRYKTADELDRIAGIE
jgi:hypothetical protein